MASLSLPPPGFDVGIDRFSSLPVELLICISSYLTNRDLKSLRLACRLLAQVAHIRVNRVFLSANPCNIRVFRTIADDEEFRHHVTEIVWDDARFIEGPKPHPHPTGEIDEADIDPDQGCPYWFVAACKENIHDRNVRKTYDIVRPDDVARGKQVITQLSLKSCWQFYQNLLQQQKDVLFSNSDVDAFIYGIGRFPKLKRITITPAAHGWIHAPLYDTPMIKSFPCGFNYPIPRGWPTSRDSQIPLHAHPWREATEDRKNQWRAFRNVVSVLAKNKLHVPELVLAVNQLPTGLNCTIFDQPCEEYDNLLTILRSPGFCRLDLPLLVGGQEHEDWLSFRSGYLKHALSEAKNMKYFSLRTTVDTDAIRDISGNPTHFIPLKTILPVEEWPELHSFRLSGFLVKQGDMINFLAGLPKTTCVIELSFLEFLDGCWHGLLTEIRDTLCWDQRDKESRPKLIIGIADSMRRAGFGIWLDNEVQDFIYGDGPNPFYPNYGDYLGAGRVGTCRDTFEPGRPRRNVDRFTIARMGYFMAEPFADML
ncbi:hypothetical protein CBS147326_6003 [Penicillium roqueforti]|nr:hypothetical protein CBS147354_4868 [Penicillium roqueforti]KAI3126253.1 hypothetical protein CBS147330_6593 [Penicillium roqueforti]KAI3130505.1 hypothetical protein CBS147326_6003 [Penicillium roqueforti]